MSEQAHRVDALRRVMGSLPDRLTPEVVTRIGAELDRGDDTAASEILLAELKARRPAVTGDQMELLDAAMVHYNNRELDEKLHPNLWWRHYVLDDLPVVSRGDGADPPMSTSDFYRMLRWVLDALADRLDPVTREDAGGYFVHGEEGLALATIASDLEVHRPSVTRLEWEKLRRLLLFGDPEEFDEAYSSLHRGEEILAALPVIDS